MALAASWKPAIGGGDYSDMTVDPMDDCTFYYASEVLCGDAKVNFGVLGSATSGSPSAQRRQKGPGICRHSL